MQVLNLILALLGGYLTYVVCIKARVDSTIAVLVGVLVGVLLFLVNIAGRLGLGV